jgi:MFS family permease
MEHETLTGIDDLVIINDVARSEPVRQRDDVAATAPATYRDVFSVREFRAVFLADVLSLLGDQIAAVALALLLYTGSGSTLLAALGYATAYVPWMLGGPVLAAWAERLPGRSVLVGCDLARATLIGLAALPGLPLPLLGLLILAAALLAPPFEAARAALLPEILRGDRYPVAMSLQGAVHQSAQLVGFVAGGALAVAVSARGALLLDAASFLISAAVIRRGVAHRRATAAGRPGDSPEAHGLLRETREGWTAIRSRPALVGSLSLGIIGAGYAIVPEAIATGYARSVGAGGTAVGLIMAAAAAGSVVGGLAIGRLVRPATRVRLIYPLAFAGTLPMMFVASRPGLALSLLLFALVGVTGAFQVAANTVFARNVPAHLRTRAFGLASSGMYGGQTLAIVLAGLAADLVAPATVVAGAGVVGAAAVLAMRRTVGRLSPA